MPADEGPPGGLTCGPQRVHDCSTKRSIQASITGFRHSWHTPSAPCRNGPVSRSFPGRSSSSA